MGRAGQKKSLDIHFLGILKIEEWVPRIARNCLFLKNASYIWARPYLCVRSVSPKDRTALGSSMGSGFIAGPKLHAEHREFHLA